MAKVKITETTKHSEHPLEDFFEIEKGSTEIREIERKTELSNPDDYDEKDSEIEENYQEIYDRAMEGYDTMVDDLEDSDPRYKARMGEVSLQHLTVALAAAKQKAGLKQHKDKLKQTATTGDALKNGAPLIIDRNELLKQMLEMKAEKEFKIIDVEVEDVEVEDVEE